MSSRIQPLEAPFPEDVAPIVASMMPSGVPPIGLFRAFAKNLPMAMAMRSWGGYELSKALSLTTACAPSERRVRPGSDGAG